MRAQAGGGAAPLPTMVPAAALARPTRTRKTATVSRETTRQQAAVEMMVVVVAAATTEEALWPLALRWNSEFGEGHRERRGRR